VFSLAGSIVAVLLVWLVLAPALARASASGDVAALQVGLRAAGNYQGTIDGVGGPATTAAVQALQRGAALAADGIVGARTRLALGAYGRHPYGSRAMSAGDSGWDVAALQFELARHGFPPGAIDGALGLHGVAALQRFQRWAGLAADGLAGPSVLAALRAPPAVSPARLFTPLPAAPVGDGFGPRGNGFHAGLDMIADAGTPVTTAGFGTVTFAGWSNGGWGNAVVVRHRFGLSTLYAHLATIAVHVGQAAGARVLLGTVGQTGRASGPHLHFEVLLRGANIDPSTALGI
jgi:peptidoglycan hydrolase-like protein with peptidoglycan-binding domain